MIGITERGDAALDTSWRSFQGPKILITKAPNKLLLSLIDPSKTIIHSTITGFGGTTLEPNVPSPDETLAAYNELCKKYHVVLRVDPIIPTNMGIHTALVVLANAKGRARISFIDMYPHVRTRFQEVGLMERITWSSFHAPLELRKDVVNMILGLSNFKEGTATLEICGEPGFECTGCVSKKDLDFFGIEADANPAGFQRGACKCLAIKKELLSNKKQCGHGCLYCYWRN